MKKVGYIFLFSLLLLVSYSVFLKLFPLRKNIFYTNNERVEEYAYNKKYFPIVIAGSSLSGLFQAPHIFNEPYFDLYLPVTGACTAVRVINITGKVPRMLFVEINHVDRGIDSTLINNVFTEPFYSLKLYLPMLLEKNQFSSNLLDRVKNPEITTVNNKRPPGILYNSLLADAKKEWSNYPDKANFGKQFSALKASLNQFALKGCKIYFFEMPMDSSLEKLPLITFQRKCFIDLAAEKGYSFIRTDSCRSYNTGDGVHLLKNDATIYLKYFKAQFEKLNQTTSR